MIVLLVVTVIATFVSPFFIVWIYLYPLKIVF